MPSLSKPHNYNPGKFYIPLKDIKEGKHYLISLHAQGLYGPVIVRKIDEPLETMHYTKLSLKGEYNGPGLSYLLDYGVSWHLRYLV